MRAFVTGATGFLGRHLVENLLDRQAYVVGLERDRVPLRGVAPATDRMVVVRGDLKSTGLLERIIAEHEVDTVFHLAAQTQVSTAARDPIGTIEANVMGTARVLEACRRQRVGRVIVASSDKCYGDGPAPYREEQPLGVTEIYGTSKVCVDQLAEAYARTFGLSVAVVRSGNLYGPGHTNFSTIIPGTIRSVLRGEHPVVRSSGQLRRDYVYVKEAAEAYVRIAERGLRGPWNVGTGVATSALEVVERILLAMRAEHLRPDVRNQACEGEIADQRLDGTKLRTVLGWEPRISLDEGIRLTIPWYEGYERAT